MSTNFANWIFKKNHQRKNKPAVVDQQNSLSYGELENHSRQFAQTLLDHGLCAGNRIIIDLPDSVLWPIAFFGSILVGLNPVLTSPDLHESSLSDVIKKVNPSAIITDSRNIQSILKIASHEIMQKNSLINNCYQFHKDESCLWLLSSGTTGSSKCVIHRHSAFEFIFQQNAQAGFFIDENTRMLCTGKLSWTYGVNTSITYTLGMGGTAYLISGTPAPSRIEEVCWRNMITHLASVPAVLASMLRHQIQLPSSVKYVFTSGEGMPMTLLERFYNTYQHQLIDVIGQSETMQVFASQLLPVASLPGKRHVLPGVELEIRDDKGQAVMPGTMGELYVRTPCSALGYHNDWYQTKKTFVGEWVRTGDMMTIDFDGHYQYKGRSDDLIKIKGLWVSNIEIENAILEDFAISDCVVVAYPNADGLDEIHAYIVGPGTASNVASRLRTMLSKHKIPRHFHFVSQLPKTVTNKSRRSELKLQSKITVDQ